MRCKVYKCVELYRRLYFMFQLDPKATEPKIRGEGILIRCDPVEDGDFEYMLNKISHFLAD